MKIIKKYYDGNLRLRVLRDGNKKIDSIMRFKVLGNGKEFPCCDFGGKCTNFAYAEVYLFMMKNIKKKGWSYLCRKHYFEEQKRFRGKLPACLSVEW